MGRLERRFPHYSRLLRLYPPAYYTEYGHELLQTLADMLDNAPTRNDRAAVWLRAVIDFPMSVLAQQTQYIGGIMTHEMPPYIKRSALIGGALLLPFFAIIASGVLSRPSLANSKAWMTLFVIGIIILPAAAFALNAATFLRWAIHDHRKSKTTYWRAVLRVQYTWPAVLTAALGLFIVATVFWHDSVHCVTGNPIREARQWHETWQCIQRG